MPTARRITFSINIWSCSVSGWLRLWYLDVDVDDDDDHDDHDDDDDDDHDDDDDGDDRRARSYLENL